MSNRDIIVIGGSAGSFEPLKEILSQVPKPLGATVLINIHRASRKGSDYFPSIIGRYSGLSTSAARYREPLVRDHIYVSPPGRGLVIESGVPRIRSAVLASPKRSIDALFESAAHSCGDRVIAVLLSGTSGDGTAGCREVRKCGGVTIAQDTSEAACASMPHAAMRDAPVDYCLRASEIASKLKELVEGVTLPPAQQKGRVMIVEDEWLLASELERQIKDLGHNVVGVVPSGEEALATVERGAPDVVIMDVRLAGEMKGTEAAQNIWERFHVPIVFLTARSDQETLSAAQASMPYAFLPKPHNAAQLHSAVQLALVRRQRELAAIHS